MYSVEVISNNGCKAFATYDVAVLPVPNVSIELEDYSVCPTENETKIELTASGAVSYKWESDVSNDQISNNLSSERLSAISDNSMLLILLFFSIY